MAIGQRFEHHSADSYRIDPREPDHYAALIRELRDQDRAPSVIAHLWSITLTAATPTAAAPLDPAHFGGAPAAWLLQPALAGPGARRAGIG